MSLDIALEWKKTAEMKAEELSRKNEELDASQKEKADLKAEKEKLEAELKELRAQQGVMKDQYGRPVSQLSAQEKMQLGRRLAVERERLDRPAPGQLPANFAQMTPAEKMAYGRAEAQAKAAREKEAGRDGRYLK